MARMNWLVFAIALPVFLQPQDKMQGKAARVNDEIITWEEIRHKYRDLGKKNLTTEFLLAALRQEAEERLFLQVAKQRKLVVSEEEIDQAVERVLRAFGGKENFEQYLRYRNMTVTEHREHSRKELMESRLYRILVQEGMYGQSILLVETISPGEIRDYYNENHHKFQALHHVNLFRIGLQFRSGKEAEVRGELAHSVRRRLLEGGDRYLTAGIYSDVRSSDVKGTDPFVLRRLQRKNKFFTEETTRHIFEELPPRTYSRVVRDGNSWNIFFILERVKKPADSFEQAQLKIRSELENRKRQENRARLLKELLKKAYVEPADLFQG